jgi:predicted nucleic acid-binding protein
MMKLGFLLDTNVLSELMRPAPHPQVLAWFAQQAASPMWTSAITQAELLCGVALLPDGARRAQLATLAEQLFSLDFAPGRVLPFDDQAAAHYALLRAQRQRAGLPITTEDAQIAAIALAAQLPLVTRNTKDFVQIEGLELINPWSE